MRPALSDLLRSIAGQTPAEARVIEPPQQELAQETLEQRAKRLMRVGVVLPNGKRASDRTKKGRFTYPGVRLQTHALCSCGQRCTRERRRVQGKKRKVTVCPTHGILTPETP